MALNVKQQIKKQGFETSQRKKKTERRYNGPLLFFFLKALRLVYERVCALSFSPI